MIRIQETKGFKTGIEKIENGDWVDLKVAAVKRVTHKRILDRKTMKIKEEKIFEDIAPQKGFFEDQEIQFFEFKKGDTLLIDLGVRIEMPDGYEGRLLPRSGLFMKTALIQTNSEGVVDNSYKGPEDIWKMPVYALDDGFLFLEERVCQFRIQRKMEQEIETVENIDTNQSRGGFGSTGIL